MYTGNTFFMHFHKIFIAFPNHRKITNILHKRFNFPHILMTQTFPFFLMLELKHPHTHMFYTRIYLIYNHLAKRAKFGFP